MTTPYYEEAGIQIWHGDCREILPTLDIGSVDLVLTDPPYPDYHTSLYQQTPIDFLNNFYCRQFVFWSAKVDFPLDYSAIHIWDKRTGAGAIYERIFERNGGSMFRMFRHLRVSSSVDAMFARDEWTKHPSQKPIQLIRELIERFSKPAALILDPFGGSGTTAVAAKQLGRRCVLIEAEERYCEIAARRLSQNVFDFEVTV